MIKEVSRKFHMCIRKISRILSRVFQECFIDVLFCDVIVSWHLLQLPKQKEGLFQRRSA